MTQSMRSHPHNLDEVTVLANYRDNDTRELVRIKYKGSGISDHVCDIFKKQALAPASGLVSAESQSALGTDEIVRVSEPVTEEEEEEELQLLELYNPLCKYY